MARRTREECKTMAGEMLAWLDEKNWTDNDKLAVTAGCLAVLIVRVAEDKDSLNKIRKFFLALVSQASEAYWEELEGPDSPHD